MVKGPREGVRRFEATEYELGERAALHVGLESQVWQSADGLRNAFTMRRSAGLRSNPELLAAFMRGAR